MSAKRAYLCALAAIVLLAGVILPAAALPRLGGQGAGPQAGDQQQLQDEAPPPPPEEGDGLVLDGTPEEIAQQCMTLVTERADACVEHNTDASTKCVTVVTLLIDQGETELANAVARWCGGSILGHTHACIRSIHRLCQRCTRAIFRAGGDADLVAQVLEHGRTESERVRQSAQDAIDAIVAVVGEGVIEEPPVGPPPPADASE